MLIVHNIWIQFSDPVPRNTDFYLQVDNWFAISPRPQNVELHKHAIYCIDLW